MNATINKTYKSFLKSVYLFSEFDDGAITMLLENAVIKEHAKGKLLFLTGDKANFFYVIINGWIKLFRETRDGHESVISVLTHGDIFGKTAILKNSSFTYTAESIADSTILQFPAAFMLQMAEDHKHFGNFLAKFLESALDETNQRCLELEHLAKMTSTERVGCFLLKMCNNKRKGSISLQFPYEKSLVAGRLGMTPETFSRSLSQLASIGIETKNTTVTIHNIEQLQNRICERCSAIAKECGLSENEEY